MVPLPLHFYVDEFDRKGENEGECRKIGRFSKRIEHRGVEPILHKEKIIFFASNNQHQWNEIGIFELSDATWTFEKTNSGPAPLSDYTVTLLPHSDTCLVFGGFCSLTNASTNDMWSFSIANKGWEYLHCKGKVPSPRNLTKSFYDEKNRYLWLYGGVDDNNNELQDLFILDLSNNQYYDCQLCPKWNEILSQSEKLKQPIVSFLSKSTAYFIFSSFYMHFHLSVPSLLASARSIGDSRKLNATTTNIIPTPVSNQRVRSFAIRNLQTSSPTLPSAISPETGFDSIFY